MGKSEDRDDDKELTMWITSVNEKTGERKREKVEDSYVVRNLKFIEQEFDRVKKETGHYPNMLAVDELYFSIDVQYKRLREKFAMLEEINILPRKGRTYSEFFYMKDKNQWYWPINRGKLMKRGYNLPYYEEEPGSFGAVRKHDIHTGVDLYCDKGTPVLAVEHGTVINIEEFTGKKAGSPWWLDTQAVWVKGSSGVVVYGEIEPSVNIGDKITPDTEIGKVLPVLKERGKHGYDAMLHLELYEEGMSETVWWKLNEPRPKYLKDPTPYLTRALAIKKPNTLRFIKD